MLNVTQSKFDEIIEKIDNLELPEGYEFPEVENILSLLSSEEGLAIALLAAEKAEDKEYVKQVNALIMNNVVIYEAVEETQEEDDDIESLTNDERISRILSDIHNIDFIAPGFIPTDSEIESLGKKNISKNDSDLAFLLWISELDKGEEPNKLMKHAARKARSVIKAKLAV